MHVEYYETEKKLHKKSIGKLIQKCKTENNGKLSHKFHYLENA